MTVKNTESVYDSYAWIYDLLFGKVFQSGRERAPVLLKLFAGARLLEVGVGTGLSLPLCSRRIDFTGIDLSQKMLDRACQRARALGLKNVHLAKMDATTLEFADNSFDRVLAAYFISTVPDPVRVIQEMKRVCRPGGTWSSSITFTAIILWSASSKSPSLLCSIESASKPTLICGSSWKRADLRSSASRRSISSGTGKPSGAAIVNNSQPDPPGSTPLRNSTARSLSHWWTNTVCSRDSEDNEKWRGSVEPINWSGRRRRRSRLTQHGFRGGERSGHLALSQLRARFLDFLLRFQAIVGRRERSAGKVSQAAHEDCRHRNPGEGDCQNHETLASIRQATNEYANLLWDRGLDCDPTAAHGCLLLPGWLGGSFELVLSLNVWNSKVDLERLITEGGH